MFLSTVDLSKQGCLDNFDLMKDWGGNLTDTVSLVRTKDPKDTMECTLERVGLRGTKLACDLLSDCYSRACGTKTEKCEGDSQAIYFYHFMCLLAKTVNETVKGCEYDTVCELYSTIPSTGKSLGNKDETDTLTLKMVLMMSGILNVVVPLAVYLYMRHQRTQDRIQSDATYELNGNPSGDHPMTELKSTPMTFTNGAAETTQLMQPSECQSVLTHSTERL